MTFRVGERVVCVDASPPRDGSAERLVLHAIYTIRGFDDECAGEPPGLLLEEIISGVPAGWKREAGWLRHRFRPLIERKTDSGVAILKKIARDVTERKKIGERV